MMNRYVSVKVKQMVVFRSEIKAVRRVDKQLRVEMLQQCSSASHPNADGNATPGDIIPRLSF
jgi:hypothetical protein